MTFEKFVRSRQDLALSLNKEESAVVIYLMYITNMTSSELFLHLSDTISKDVIEKFDLGFKRYLYDNYPIQYLTKYQTFYGYDFYCDERVLIPRFETEELVENVLMYYDKHFNGKHVEVCDIGTGSGAIGISLALEEKNMHVSVSDISKDALEVVKINNDKFNANVDIYEGDMGEPLIGKKFDIIVSNPPYIPDTEEVMSLVKDNEPNIALFGGADGLKFYRQILDESKKLGKERFMIAFEHGYNKNNEIEAIIKAVYPDSKVIHKKDMQGRDRMSFAFIGDFDE